MPAFRSILVAADFSEESRQAFRVACSLASEDETLLFVLNVLEPAYVADGPVHHNQASVPIIEAKRPASDFAAAKERLRQAYCPDRPIGSDFHASEGQPAEVILRIAEELECDLIVLGTHGRTGLGRLLAGSVAEAVLRRAGCPVLAFHGTGTPQATVDPEVILHPTDFSEGSEAALRMARDLARVRGARLVIMHAMPSGVAVLGSIPVSRDSGAVRDSLDAMAGGADGADLKYPVEARMAQGDAATAILRVAGEIDCGMIAMGTHGRTGLARLLMGSVAEAVLRRARCPVLTVRPAAPATEPSWPDREAVTA